jgi:hypothetical protein
VEGRRQCAVDQTRFDRRRRTGRLGTCLFDQLARAIDEALRIDVGQGRKRRHAPPILDGKPPISIVAGI